MKLFTILTLIQIAVAAAEDVAPTLVTSPPKPLMTILPPAKKIETTQINTAPISAVVPTVVPTYVPPKLPAEHFVKAGVEQPKDLHDLMTNLMFLGGATAAEPLVNGMVRGLEMMLDQGRRSLKNLAGMMVILDEAPPLQAIINELTRDVEIVERKIDDLTNGVRYGASTIRIIVNCLAQDEELIRHLKNQVIRDVKQVVDQQRGVLRDLLASGQAIREKLRNMQIIERKLLSSSTTEEALQEGVKTRQAAEGEARSMERTFISALETFQLAIVQSIDGLSLALQNVEINGKRILRDVQICMAQQEAADVEEQGYHQSVESLPQPIA